MFDLIEDCHARKQFRSNKKQELHHPPARLKVDRTLKNRRIGDESRLSILGQDPKRLSLFDADYRCVSFRFWWQNHFISHPVADDRVFSKQNAVVTKDVKLDDDVGTHPPDRIIRRCGLGFVQPNDHHRENSGSGCRQGHTEPPHRFASVW